MGQSRAQVTFLHRHRQSGQVLIEYVIILVILVAAATALVSRLIGRDPQNPGFVITSWNSIALIIAQDNPDSTSAKPKLQ